MKNILSLVILGVLSISFQSCSKTDKPSQKLAYGDLPPAIEKMIADIDCEAANKQCGFTLTKYELNGKSIYVVGMDYSLDNGIICCFFGSMYYDEQGVQHIFEVGKDGKDFYESTKLIGEVWKCSDPQN